MPPRLVAITRGRYAIVLGELVDNGALRPRHRRQRLAPRVASEEGLQMAARREDHAGCVRAMLMASAEKAAFEEETNVLGSFGLRLNAAARAASPPPPPPEQPPSRGQRPWASPAGVVEAAAHQLAGAPVPEAAGRGRGSASPGGRRRRSWALPRPTRPSRQLHATAGGRRPRQSARHRRRRPAAASQARAAAGRFVGAAAAPR